MIPKTTASNPDQIFQGVAVHPMGFGFDNMVRVAWCRDCGWSITPDEIDDASTLKRANGLVSSRQQGHAYFKRGHRTSNAYLPLSIHPDPFAGTEHKKERGL
jgi:hypothetical protein